MHQCTNSVELSYKAKITISNKIKKIHPVVKNIIGNLSELEFIHFIKLSPEYLQASNELTEGRVKIPVTKPEHPTVVGIHLIIDIACKDIQFYEITSAIKGCGGEMVNAVLKVLPKGWNGVVAMDWSNGFWAKMIEKHKNLNIL